MPNLTPNYSFKKPIKATENADIDVLNSNMDILDTELKKVSDKANTKEIVTKLITISKTSWTSDSGIYSYTISDSNITSLDVVDINISTTNIINGNADDLLSATTSGAGTCKIYSKSIPKVDLSATMIIQKEA